MNSPPLIIAIVGSERVPGDTARVVEFAKSGFADLGIQLEAIHLSEQFIVPCGPCGGCNNRPTKCSIDDDLEALISRMVKADGIIYATPVHGFGTASLMQVFIERAGVGHLRFARPLENKVAGAVVVGRRYSHMDVLSQLHHNILLNRMILVGSGFPVTLSTTEGRPALDDQEGVQALVSMITRMSEMIWLLQERSPSSLTPFQPPLWF